MSCCTTTDCLDRVLLPGGGWACRTALASGRLLDTTKREGATLAPGPRRPGWSRGAVLPCPRCGCRAYAPGPNGLPERRCHAVGHVWDPEA